MKGWVLNKHGEYIYDFAFVVIFDSLFESNEKMQKYYYNRIWTFDTLDLFSYKTYDRRWKYCQFFVNFQAGKMNIYYILSLYVTVNKSLSNAYGNIAKCIFFKNQILPFPWNCLEIYGNFLRVSCKSSLRLLSFHSNLI